MGTEQAEASRRNFIVGGVAAAAIVGPLAIAAGGSTAPTGSSWNPLAPAKPAELSEWQGLVGSKFHIVGEAGKYPAKLSSVLSSPSDPTRPSGLRPLSFITYFEMNPSLAPVGQKTYKVVHPTKGVMDVFLGRGANRGAWAIVYAIFN
jgi:hypothetical protein